MAEGLVARTRLFPMISFAFDLPKAFASASRSLLRASSHRYQMKKTSSYR
jgi:hypothetical protein